MGRTYSESLLLKKLLEDGPVTVLVVDNDQFLLEIVRDVESQDRTHLQAADMNSILTSITNEPVKAIEIEAAIADIEDQLMPVIKDLPERRCLVTSEQAFWEIAKVAGFESKNQIKLKIDTVEEVFNRLVDVAYGTPASMLDVPEDREFTATVIFLRELMHHAGFTSYTLVNK